MASPHFFRKCRTIINPNVHMGTFPYDIGQNLIGYNYGIFRKHPISWLSGKCMLKYSVNKFFILTLQFVKYSRMFLWLYNHLFWAVQSMFPLIQLSRPVCNHQPQVTFFKPWIEILFSTQLQLKWKILQEFQIVVQTVLMPLIQLNCTKC